MNHLLDPADTDQELPRRTGIVIIGAGVIGISTALSLAERGVAVVVLEKGRVAAEQSSRNWGWCRTTGRDPAEIPLAMESVRMWDRMAPRVGADVGFRRAGTAYVAETDAEMGVHTAWLDSVREYQTGTRVLSAAEAAAIVPGAAVSFVGGVHTPQDGRAEPHQAVPAMVAALRRLGGIVLEGCAARGLDLQAGRVAGVITERGRIACEGAVLAGGAWSRLFCGNQGVDLPQLRVLGSVMRTAPLPGPEVTSGGQHWAIRKRTDGGYTIARRNASITPITPDSFRQLPHFGRSFLQNRRELKLRLDASFLAELRTKRSWGMDDPTPFEATRVLDPAPNQASLDFVTRDLARVLPVFAGMKVTGTWGGMIDATPDGIPVIGPVPGTPGFHLATGFSGHGFGIGPGAGRLMADMVVNDAPVVDPTPFRLERFTRATAG